MYHVIKAQARLSSSSCYLHHGRNSSSSNHHCHHHHGPKASYSMGSNHMDQWRLWRHKTLSSHLQQGSTISKGSKHHQGISNMAPPSPWSSWVSIMGFITSSGSSWDHHQLIMSTSINLAASYCDHCKGHHQVSRLHITVVVIKDNHQSGVGINDNLQQ